jgi:hypothetical protein
VFPSGAQNSDATGGNYGGEIPSLRYQASNTGAGTQFDTLLNSTGTPAQTNNQNGNNQQSIAGGPVMGTHGMFGTEGNKGDDNTQQYGNMSGYPYGYNAQLNLSPTNSQYPYVLGYNSMVQMPLMPGSGSGNTGGSGANTVHNQHGGYHFNGAHHHHHHHHGHQINQPYHNHYNNHNNNQQNNQIGSGNNGHYNLHDIIALNFLPAMCSSQHGARSLQAELDFTQSTLKQPHLIQIVFAQLLPYIFRLSVHPFANYVVQKLIDNLPNTSQTTLIGTQTLAAPQLGQGQPPPYNPSKTVVTFEPLLPPQQLFTPREEWNAELQRSYDDAQLAAITAQNSETTFVNNQNNTQNGPNGVVNNNASVPTPPWAGLSIDIKAPPLPCEPEISPQYYCLLMLRAFNFGSGLHSLCTDPFGCRVVQKILDVFASASQSATTTGTPVSAAGAATTAPTSPDNSPALPDKWKINDKDGGKGKREVAVSVANLSPILKEAYGIIYHHIAPHFYTFSVHQHANHVIQKCIETIPGFLNHPVFIPLFYPKTHQYRLYQKFIAFQKEEECVKYSQLTNGSLPALPLYSQNGEEVTKKAANKGAKRGGKKDSDQGKDHAVCGLKGGVYNYTQDSIVLGQFDPNKLSSAQGGSIQTDDNNNNNTNAVVNGSENNASYAIFYNTKLVLQHMDPLLNSSFTTYATTQSVHRDHLERLTRMMGQQQREVLQQQRERERQYAQQQQQQQQAEQQPLSNGFILGGVQNYNGTVHGLDRFNNDNQNDLWYYLGQVVSLSQEKKQKIAEVSGDAAVSTKAANTADDDESDDDDDDDDDEDIDDEFDFTVVPTTPVQIVKYKKNLLRLLQERDDLYYSQFPFIYSSTSNIALNKKLLFHQLFATNLHDGYHLSPFTSLSTHTYGCRVIQRIYSFCGDQNQRELLLKQITESFLPLVQDLFGNYVIQHILSCGNLYDIQHITSLLRGNVLAFAMNKCSSNVVEKALQCGNGMVVESIIQELLTPIHTQKKRGNNNNNNNNTTAQTTAVVAEEDGKDGSSTPVTTPTQGGSNNRGLQHDMNIPLVAMIAHPFANYVVQTILSVCLHEQKNNLISLIKRVSVHIELNEYSKKILLRVDPRGNFSRNANGEQRTNNKVGQNTGNNTTFDQVVSQVGATSPGSSTTQVQAGEFNGQNQHVPMQLRQQRQNNNNNHNNGQNQPRQRQYNNNHNNNQRYHNNNQRQQRYDSQQQQQQQQQQQLPVQQQQQQPPMTDYYAVVMGMTPGMVEHPQPTYEMYGQQQQQQRRNNHNNNGQRQRRPDNAVFTKF